MMNKNKFLFFFCFVLLLVSCKDKEAGKAPKETKRYIELLESLSEDKNEVIQINIAGNASTPTEILEDLALSENPEIRASVAANLGSPIELLTKLGNDSTYEVKFGLAYNPHTPTDILQLMITNDKKVQNIVNTIANVSKLDMNMFKSLYSDPEMKDVISTNPNLTVGQIQQIFNDGVGYYGLAMNPNTPSPILEQLSNMVDSIPEMDGTTTLYHPYVLSLAANSSLPSNLIHKLMTLDNNNLNDGMFSFEELLALNPNTPVEILELFAKDTNTSQYYAVSANPKTPYEVIKLYFNSENKYLRANAAANQNIPTDSLSVLALSKDSAIRKGVAMNKNTNVSDLILLSTDKDDEVREYVARNPKSPIECLERLASDSAVTVRAAVADYQVLHITFYSDETPYRTEK